MAGPLVYDLCVILYLSYDYQKRKMGSGNIPKALTSTDLSRTSGFVYFKFYWRALFYTI